jgi:hypothetical protein
MIAFLLPFLPGVWNFAKAAWAFCAKPPGSYIACAALIALALWIANARGYERGTADANAAHKAADARAQAEVAKAGSALETTLATLNAKTTANFASVQTHTIYLTQTIVQRIPVYVSPKTDRDFPLPCGLVRLHDAGILGADPAALAAAGCQTDDQPAPAAASAFSRNDAEWSGYCHEVEAQRDALKAELLGVVQAWADYRVSLAQTAH